MAIKIGGTTVIDDSCNICNINTYCSTTFIGDGSQLTGIPTPPDIITPVNVSPANGATGITATFTLQGGSYYSLYGKTMDLAATSTTRMLRAGRVQCAGSLFNLPIYLFLEK